MAYLSPRPDGRIEIRESVRTPRGPRAHTLTSFRGLLSPEHLDEAQQRASRPFDRARLQRQAGELGVGLAEWAECRPARELLTRLRRGERIEPALARRLRELLEPSAAAPTTVAEELAEWTGSSDAERGEALRGLLRVSDRALRSRGALREAPERAFPRFRSGPTPEGQAS